MTNTQEPLSHSTVLVQTTSSAPHAALTMIRGGTEAFPLPSLPSCSKVTTTFFGFSGIFVVSEGKMDTRLSLCGREGRKQFVYLQLGEKKQKPSCCGMHKEVYWRRQHGKVVGEEKLTLASAAWGWK